MNYRRGLKNPRVPPVDIKTELKTPASITVWYILEGKEVNMGWFGWGSDGDKGEANVKVTHDTLHTKTEVIKSTDGDKSNHSHEGVTRNDFTGKESSFSKGPKNGR